MSKFVVGTLKLSEEQDEMSKMSVPIATGYA